MNEKEQLTLDDVFALAFAGQMPGVAKRHAEMKTPSGRVFKYELSEYPIGADATPERAHAQAARIFREKYRYCEWDRNHPEVDVESEMITKIVSFILSEARAIRRAEARKPKVYACWGIFFNGKMVEEFPYAERDGAQRRLDELLAKTPGQYYLQQIKRTGGAGGA